MARIVKKDSSKKKELLKETTIEEEKWKGLEKKIWTGAEFGFYVILIAFTIFAVGFRASSLLEDNKDLDNAKYIENNNNSIYINLADQCNDLNNCSINTELDYHDSSIVLEYDAQDGVGVLNLDGLNLNFSPIKELAILSNGYLATFTNQDDINKITYYNLNGDVIKEFNTKLASNGRLDSNTGVYAVCNTQKLEVVKYTILNNGEFNEELLGNYNSDEC